MKYCNVQPNCAVNLLLCTVQEMKLFMSHQESLDLSLLSTGNFSIDKQVGKSHHSNFFLNRWKKALWLNDVRSLIPLRISSCGLKDHFISLIGLFRKIH